MGQKPSNQINYKPLTKQNLDNVLGKVYHHCHLIRDRKKDQINVAEKNLLNIIRSTGMSLNQESLFISKICEDYNFVRGLELVIKYTELLKNYTNYIAENIYSPPKMAQVMPAIETILYSVEFANLYSIEEFKSFIQIYLNPNVMSQLQNSPNVDPQLKNYIQTLKPTTTQISECWVSFANRNNLSLSEIRRRGHEAYTQEELNAQRMQMPFVSNSGVGMESLAKPPPAINQTTNGYPVYQKDNFEEMLSNAGKGGFMGGSNAFNGFCSGNVISVDPIFLQPNPHYLERLHQLKASLD